MNELTKDEIIEELNYIFHCALNTDYCIGCKNIFCRRSYCKATEGIVRDILKVINGRKINE